jgi:hypothetical protein
MVIGMAIGITLRFGFAAAAAAGMASGDAIGGGPAILRSLRSTASRGFKSIPSHGEVDLSDAVRVNDARDDRCRESRAGCWPPWSPDLNPIENLWNVLKARVYARFAQSLEEMEHFIREEWAAVDLTFISHICRSMPLRLQLLLDNNGHKISY